MIDSILHVIGLCPDSHGHLNLSNIFGYLTTESPIFLEIKMRLKYFLYLIKS